MLEEDFNKNPEEFNVHDPFKNKFYTSPWDKMFDCSLIMCLILLAVRDSEYLDAYLEKQYEYFDMHIKNDFCIFIDRETVIYKYDQRIIFANRTNDLKRSEYYTKKQIELLNLPYSFI
jgi:hypothetical protein